MGVGRSAMRAVRPGVKPKAGCARFCGRPTARSAATDERNGNHRPAQWHLDWPADRMPEAEVALRLAEYISQRPGFGGHVEVAVDGASVRVGETEVFDIIGYLAWAGWAQDKAGTGRNAWATLYRRGHATLRVHSRSGQGDVEATVNGRRIIAECKKGPLTKKPGSPEYPLLTTAIGQALLFDANETDLVVAAGLYVGGSAETIPWAARHLD